MPTRLGFLLQGATLHCEGCLIAQLLSCPGEKHCLGFASAREQQHDGVRASEVDV